MVGPGRQPVVLLGASNLTLGFPLLLKLLQRSFPGPVEVFAAHGHGRSFGISSTVFARSLPGITVSRLFGDLEQALESSTAAPCVLITDIGNDVMYGVPVPQILEWVEACVEACAVHEAHITLTQLPLASLQTLGPRRFRIARSLLFPRAKLTWDELLPVVEQLAAGVRNLAERRHAQLIAPRADWYGLDPIHIRRSARPEAWREIVSAWPLEQTVPRLPAPALFECARVWRFRPAERTLLGRRQLRTQPTHRSERLTVHLY